MGRFSIPSTLSEKRLSLTQPSIRGRVRMLTAFPGLRGPRPRRRFGASFKPADLSRAQLLVAGDRLAYRSGRGGAVTSDACSDLAQAADSLPVRLGAAAAGFRLGAQPVPDQRSLEPDIVRPAFGQVKPLLYRVAGLGWPAAPHGESSTQSKQRQDVPGATTGGQQRVDGFQVAFSGVQVTVADAYPAAGE